MGVLSRADGAPQHAISGVVPSTSTEFTLAPTSTGSRTIARSRLSAANTKSSASVASSASGAAGDVDDDDNGRAKRP